MTPKRRGHLRRFEKLLGRVELLPWCGLYRVAIGFCLVPVFTRYRGASSDWRLLPFFVAVLLTLRLVPAAIRWLVPFSAELQAQWFQRRLLGKRFDSYQWSKLVWFGLGIMLYGTVFDRMGPAPTALVCACLLMGSCGLVVWRRHGRMAWEGLDLVPERSARPQ